MSKIEKVSAYEILVWRVKGWFSLNAVSVMLFMGLILAVFTLLPLENH